MCTVVTKIWCKVVFILYYGVRMDQIACQSAPVSKTSEPIGPASFIWSSLILPLICLCIRSNIYRLLVKCGLLKYFTMLIPGFKGRRAIASEAEANMLLTFWSLGSIVQHCPPNSKRSTRQRPDFKRSGSRKKYFPWSGSLTSPVYARIPA